MIIMRVVESAFRNYYQKITSKEPENFWGKMLSDLEKIESIDKILLGYFTYLKDIRNKLQHPDARFSQSEAETAFIHAVNIMNTIHS